MISKREATRLMLRCDACSTREDVYLNDPHQYWVLPEGWASVPPVDALIEDAEPEVVLCPKHAGLIDTVYLVHRLIDQKIMGATEKTS